MASDNVIKKGYVSRDKHGTPRQGEQVDGLLTKIQDLANATWQVDGTLSRQDKKKLDTQVPDSPMSILEIDEICNF